MRLRYALCGAAIAASISICATNARAETSDEPVFTATWQTGAPVVEAIPETLPDAGEPPVAIDPGEAGREQITAEQVEAVGEPNTVWEDIGTYKLTFYCPCYQCSEGWGHQTSSGATCQEGVTVACATIPAGTRIRIEGYGERIVQDTGGGVKGRHIDVFMESHSECLKHGVKYAEVSVRR